MGVRAADIAVRAERAPPRPAAAPFNVTLEASVRLSRGSFALKADLRLPARGVSVLFGSSGAGKTTLLRCIAGLTRAPRGYVRVGDACWQDSERGLWLAPHRRRIGYVFQDAALFPHLDVRGNLHYARRRAPHGVVSLDAVVDELALDGLLDRFPDQLSGGESRRVAIARALLAAPTLLLMDEPLSGLDGPARKAIMGMLEQLHAKLSIPIVYVTHSITETTRLANYIVLLESGQVKAAGAAAEIATRLDLPFAREDEASAVLDTVVAAYDRTYQLTRLDFDGGCLDVARQSLAVGQKLRVRIGARDVSIALKANHESSILNILPARIAAITMLDGGRVLLKLDAGGAQLLARITRKSFDALGLHEGIKVFAQIKSVAILDG